jgi:tripartite motif-containing protein 2/3/tripartite motif-containing protein 71
VAGLQAAFHINRFLEIKESFHNIAATPEGATTCVGNSKKAGKCLVHEDKELELYCETCNELTCWKCIARGGKHHDHMYDELSKAFEKYKGKIVSLLEPMEKQVMTVTQALVQLDERCGEISNQREATAGKIHTSFRRLREVLDVRETELIDLLDKVAQAKLKHLGVQKDQIETTLAKLNSCLCFMRDSLKRDAGDEGDVVRMEAHKIEELTIPLQPDILKPNTDADITFSTSTDMIATCQNYGELSANSHASVTGEDTLAVVGMASTAVLKADKCEAGSLVCEIISEITDTRASCDVECKISYLPTVKGRHHIHLKAEGKHVKGSPFLVNVKSPVEKLGTHILSIGELRKPRGVAVNRSGELVVTEWNGRCVSILSPRGLKSLSFDTGTSSHPCEVAVDDNGDILVVDSANHCFQKFTPEGQLIASAGTKGSGPLQFNNPTGIAVNPTNRKLYVTDTKNARVQILNSDLTFDTTFGRKGFGNGQFNYPSGIACDNSGNVYIADTYNDRIQVFTAVGEFALMIGGSGDSGRELHWPYGVAVDKNVYVSEDWNGRARVSVFTWKGQLVTSFGREGGGPGDFMHPRGLAVDSCGVLYVCDGSNDRIQLF